MKKTAIYLKVLLVLISNAALSQVTSYPIIFSTTAGGLTGNNGVWTATGAGGWVNVGLSSQIFAGNARIMMKYEAGNAIYGMIGVDTSNSLPSSDYYNNTNHYNNMNAGVAIFPGGVVKMAENNAGVSVGTVAIGDWVCLYRSGATFKVQKSSDNRVTWTDLGTLIFTSSASLYITTSVWSGSKLYYPTLEFPTVVNDAACNATIITAGESQLCGTNANATSVNDPSSGCSTPDNSVWYQYTATSTGTVKLVVTTPGSPANPLQGWASWYSRTGTCPDVTFSGIGNCQQFGEGGNNDIDYLVSPVLTAGTTYYVMIYGYAGDVGDFCLNIQNCSPVLSVQVENIISTGARVSWAGTGTFILEYGPVGFTPGTGAVAGAGGIIIDPAVSSQTITGLTASTGYDVYIRQNCVAGNNGYSSNSPVVTFTTASQVTSYPIIFSTTAGGLTGNNGVWTATGPGGWVNVGLSSQIFAGNARIMMKYEAGNAIYGMIGVDTSNSLPSSDYYNNTNHYNNMNAGVAIFPGGVVKMAENNAGVSVGTVAIGDWVCLYRSGATFKVQKSSDNRVTWTDLGTLIFTSSASLYITTSVWSGSKLYYPTLEFPTVVNDAACNATIITAGESQLCGTNANATSVNDPSSGCSTPDNSVWYQYTATSTGTVKLVVTTPGSPANPLQGWASWYSRTGTCPDVTFSGIGNCQQFGEGGNNDIDYLVSPVLTAGTTYYVMIYGYAGDVGDFCLNIQNCSPVLSVQVENIISTGARVSWAGTGSFILEYGPAGFTPGTGAAAGAGGIIIDPAVSSQTITGLTASTGYDVYIRQNCVAGNNGYSSNSPVVTFTTLPPPPVNDDCSGAITLTVYDNICGGATQGTTLNATTSSTTPLPECGIEEAGYDDDVWFKFTPLTGQEFVAINFMATGGDINFKAQVYTSSDNTCSGTFSSYACSEDILPGSSYVFTSLPVSAGTTYFIRVFSYSRNVYSQFTVCITTTLLINDNATGAILVNVDDGCTGVKYTNAGASQSVDEPSGTCSSTTGYATAWYKFIAPEGGAVRVSTAIGSGNILTNSRVALFEASIVNNYNTFNIIACDEDGGSGGFGSMSVLFATGLTPGFTYYIQVDKFDSSSAEGTFCLTVENFRDTMLSASNNCNSIYQTPVGSIAAYKGWVSLIDDNSRLIALVRNSNGSPVNAYTVSQYVKSGPVRKDNISGDYYLNRNYSINNTLSPGDTVNVQFFFKAGELDALKAVDQAAALANLRVTRQTASICQPDFIAANGANSELSQTGNGTSNGVTWINVNTTGFSNFYIHAVKSYLSTKIFLQGAYSAALGRHKDVTTAWANVLNTYAKNQPYTNTIFEGFGSGTPGGKGQEVIHVTNLNSSGPGSLRDAMGSNRTIVFDVGGTISGFRWLASENFSVSYLTIDGSTAPAPGITLDNAGAGGSIMAFDNNCHNVIVKNIRARNAEFDGFNVVNGHDFVFDHISSSNNGDANMDITQGSVNITVQNCIFGGGISTWSGNMLIGYSPTRNISIHHNLFSPKTAGGVGERNPLINWIDGATPSDTTIVCDFRNNVVWRWGRNDATGSGYGTSVSYKATANIINNYYYSIAFPESAVNIDDGYGQGISGKAFVSGNVSGNIGVDPNSISNAVTPWAVAPVITQDACTAATRVLTQAGCQPLDLTDQALINAIYLPNCPANTTSIGNNTGVESVANGYYSATSSTTDVIDWVLLEIKDSASSDIVARRAAFVREDGQVVDLDGVSPVSLPGLGSGNYYLTIRHRNHLSISTQNLLSFSTKSLGVAPAPAPGFDFTIAADSTIFGDASAYKIISGINVMIGGNANGNSNVRYTGINNDAAAMLAALGSNQSAGLNSVYHIADVNMDGTLRYTGLNNDAAALLSVLNGVQLESLQNKNGNIKTKKAMSERTVFGLVSLQPDKHQVCFVKQKIAG